MEIPIKSEHITQASDNTYKFSMVLTILVIAATFIAVIALIAALT
jgi:hypothetical protein